MSRRKKVLAALLAILLLIVGLVAWQRNNIAALLSFARFSQEELEEKIAENDQKIKDAVEKLPDVTIRDITEEEKQGLRDGTLAQEELVESLIKPVDKPAPEPQQKPEEPVVQQPQQENPDVVPQPEPKPEEQVKAEYEKKLSAVLAKVYVLREEFLLKLDSLQADALAEYRALSEEYRSVSKLTGLVGKYMSIGLDLEKQCDQKMDEILIELEELIKENNGDPSLPQTVFDTYVEEKSLKKALYMEKLRKRGLV